MTEDTFIDAVAELIEAAYAAGQEPPIDPHWTGTAEDLESVLFLTMLLNNEE